MEPPRWAASRRRARISSLLIDGVRAKHMAPAEELAALRRSQIDRTASSGDTGTNSLPRLQRGVRRRSGWLQASVELQPRMHSLPLDNGCPEEGYAPTRRP